MKTRTDVGPSTSADPVPDHRPGAATRPKIVSFLRPANAFCNVFVAKAFCKFAAREADLGHPRSDKSRNGQIGFHLKNPPSVHAEEG
jgi:hypothetical protein